MKKLISLLLSMLLLISCSILLSACGSGNNGTNLSTGHTTCSHNYIVAERKANGRFKNLTDFAKRCAPIMNKRILEAFAKTGVLDSLEPNRAAIYMNADAILSYAAKSRDGANMLSLFANTVAVSW